MPDKNNSKSVESTFNTDSLNSKSQLNESESSNVTRNEDEPERDVESNVGDRPDANAENKNKNKNEKEKEKCNNKCVI